MSDTVPEGATPVGRKLYLFKSKSNSTDCLISAHGGYYKKTSAFKVDGCEIIFYGPHGAVLQDPGVRLIDYPGEPVQTIPNAKDGNMCLDYVLSKYQGSHGGTVDKPAETYQSIHRRVKYNDDTLTDKFNTATTSKNAKLVGMLLKSIKNYQTMSVVTIRNRWFMAGGDIHLSEVIKEVRGALPNVKRFHCSFCRSLVGDENAPSAAVSMR